ncbi:MAG: hypothetical protein GQ477_03420 [Nanohaloarchaea archaeon]|nr:hypothetical protein [Candidatus Nanohaloarchaea archaeon]
MFGNRYFSSIVLVVLLVSMTFAYGTAVNINVAEFLDSTSKEIDCCNLDDKVMTASYDVFNSGSIAYAARIRMDVFDEGEMVTSIWSREYRINPAQRETIDLYWYEQSDKILFANAKLYRAYDILDIGNVTWEFNEAEVSQSVNDLESLIGFDKICVYDNKIKFEITTDEDIEKMIIYPIQYTKGWIFEQTVVNDVISGKSKKVSIDYDTGAFFEDEITLIAVSSDGRYYGEKTFLLKKEVGLKKWFNMFMDALN